MTPPSLLHRLLPSSSLSLGCSHRWSWLVAPLSPQPSSGCLIPSHPFTATCMLILSPLTSNAQVWMFQLECPQGIKTHHAGPTQLASSPVFLMAWYHPGLHSSLSIPLPLTVMFCGVCPLHSLQSVCFDHLPPPRPFGPSSSTPWADGSASLPLIQCSPNPSWDQCSQYAGLGWDWGQNHLEAQSMQSPGFPLDTLNSHPQEWILEIFVC